MPAAAVHYRTKEEAKQARIAALQRSNLERHNQAVARKQAQAQADTAAVAAVDHAIDRLSENPVATINGIGLTVKALAQTHKPLLKSCKEEVRLAAVKLGYQVHGLLDSGSRAPLAQLNVAILTAAAPLEIKASFSEGKTLFPRVGESTDAMVAATVVDSVSADAVTDAATDAAANPSAGQQQS